MDMPPEIQPSLRDFLNILFKRKVQVLVFFISTFCAVAIATFAMQPIYEASSQILVKIGRENLYVPTVPGSGNSPVVTVHREEQVNSEIEIIKSRTLAEEVVKALDPKAIYKELRDEQSGILALVFGSKTRLSPEEMAVVKLEKDLTVEAVKKANVIQITYRNRNPIVAATVVNTLVEFFLQRHLDVFKSPESYSFFEEQSRLLKEKLTQSEDNLKYFKEKHHLTSLPEQKSLLLKEASDLRTALNQTMSQSTETQHRLDQLRIQLRKVPKTVDQGNEIDHNPYIISSLQARLVELELKQKELTTKYSDENQLVQNVKEDISMVRRTLDDQEKKLYGKSRSGMNTTYQRIEEDLFKNEAELKALTAKQTAQSEQLTEHQNQLNKLNGVEVELSHFEREVEVDRQNFRLYLAKFEESRISGAMDSEKIANISIIEPARIPLKPAKPNIPLNLALGFLLGSIGGVGLAFFREYLDDTLEKPEQIEKALQVPVLASVPEFIRQAIKS
jgi:polysaccharide chain length determinant protein (PEP-CTERM system associated)